MPRGLNFFLERRIRTFVPVYYLKDGGEWPRLNSARCRCAYFASRDPSTLSHVSSPGFSLLI